jgi:hypothetical protein
LTVGAVLIAKELQSAVRLLSGAALIVGGAAVIAAGTASFPGRNAPPGAAITLGGIALIVGGIAHISDRDTPAGAALIAAGAAVIATGTAVIVTRASVFPAGARTIGILAIFWFGTGLIQSGVALVSGGRHGFVVGYPDDLKRHVVAAKAASASAGAILIAVIVRGSSVALIWTGLFMYFAAGVVFVAAFIGPRTIASRIRQAVDWAIKAPQATQGSDT